MSTQQESILKGPNEEIQNQKELIKAKEAEFKVKEKETRQKYNQSEKELREEIDKL